MKILIASFIVSLVMFVSIRHVMPQGIVFYQGVAVAFVIGVAQFIFQIYWMQHAKPEALKDAFLSFLLFYSFIFTIPTTVDRAYSVKMLNRLAEAPAGLDRNEIGAFFVKGFLAEGGVDKRLVEQKATGSIKEENGRFVLTPLGRFLEASFKLTQVVFACGENKK